MNDHRDLIENLFDKDFDSNTFKVDNLKIYDKYEKIDFKKIKEIYISPETDRLSLENKFNKLKNVDGFVHLVDGISLEISNEIIKYFKLRDKSIEKITSLTKEEVEHNLGKADKELTEGIMWATGYVVESRVLVYNKAKLFIHIDNETDRICEIRYGDVNENVYD
ncbi:MULTISPECIES: hypothetical protein [Flavobacterium]|uniref:hypothetical protein n=1 Tax=Flavobacterium TaxID=237 RepID=UPI001FCBA28E|nr:MULTISPECIES: hypothetical protein [Flavobacterium]UOK42200.1 hypothetical protein LZF87_12885 [Flavobacterium enshiense]